MKHPKDLTGQRFERWTVVGPSPVVRRSRRRLCKCDCGAEREVVGASLVNGSSRSCGCLQRSVAAAQSTLHGGVGTPEYAAWKHMKERCYNPNENRYSRYGGRGIVVCDRWLSNFENFFADLGPRPSSRHSIDRIDVNGNYEPGNVRWATAATQSRNKECTAFIDYRGRIVRIDELARELGVKENTLHKRAQRGSFGFSYAGVAASDD